MTGAPDVRKPVVNTTTISLFVAALSLCTAMYQGYLNTRAVGVFSRDVEYRETMRACREAVEYFMEARLRIKRLALSQTATDAVLKEERAFEAERTVARFAAVATYLANYNEGARRDRYTKLVRDLEALIRAGAVDPAKGVDLAKVDEEFFHLNNDCVASVRKP
ncbi:MAG: hypothetical protein AB7F96_13360 [Beijerinckiaceae bacterium]